MLRILNRKGVLLNFRKCSAVPLQLRASVCQEEKSQDLWNADGYSKHGAYVYLGASRLIKLAQLKPGERVLDLGCGPGELAKFYQSLGCEVLAVDSSPVMVAAAKAKGIDARLFDAHDLPFNNTFDVVISNYALHWMSKDPSKVVQNVRKSLKQGGRFVGEFAAKGCLESIFHPLEVVLETNGISFSKINPWFIPTDNEYKRILKSKGFQVKQISTRARSIPLEMGPIGWLELFAGILFVNTSNTHKRKMYDEILARMHPIKLTNKGEFVADYVDLLFLAFNK